MAQKIMVALTLMLGGRAMTLAFLFRAGGAQAGDPPAAWLMPLLGDAIIGLSAFVIAYLIAAKRGLAVWTAVVVWNALAIWDAMSAFVLHLTAPWPSFFMVEIFGASMFFAASAMHAAILAIAFTAPVRAHFFGGATDASLNALSISRSAQGVGS